MKIILAESRKELNSLLDALELTDQNYVIERVQFMRDTGRTATTKIDTVWRITIDPPHEEDEPANAIGFQTEGIFDDEEDDWDEDEEEIDF